MKKLLWAICGLSLCCSIVDGMDRIPSASPTENRALLNPVIDVVFKRIFGSTENIDVLKHFLNSILHLQGEDIITSLTLNNTEVSPEVMGDKLSRMDILATTQKKEMINIEIQVRNAGDIVGRSLYYWSRLYSSSLKEGAPYEALPKTIMINILNYNAFHDNSPRRTLVLKDNETNAVMTDLMALHFFELKKFRMDVSTAENMWMSFLKNPSYEPLHTQMAGIPELKKAEDTLRIASNDKVFMDSYFQRQKDLTDQISALKAAKDEGLQQGIQEGLQQGIQRGLIRNNFRVFREAYRASTDGKVRFSFSKQLLGVSRELVEQALSKAKKDEVYEAFMAAIIGIQQTTDDSYALID